MVERARPTPNNDLAALARRYRAEAVAALRLAMREPEAPGTSSRVAAATKMLELSDGRPSAARQITVADLPSMTEDQRNELLAALIFQYEADMPGRFRQMLQEITDTAMEQLFSSMAATPPPRMLLPPAEPAPINHARKITRPGHNEPEPPPPPPPPYDNVIPMPRGMHPLIENPLLAGDGTHAHAHGSVSANGAVHPDVLRRSAQPNPLALDSYTPWRSR